MKARDIATMVAGVVVTAASAAAGGLIRLLLTSPMTVATAVEGRDGGALEAVARTLYEALSKFVQSL
jgi:hypothetical protein